MKLGVARRIARCSAQSAGRDAVRVAVAQSRQRQPGGRARLRRRRRRAQGEQRGA